MKVINVRERIARVLAMKNLSARGVSLSAGLSDSMLHKYLTGQTHSITVDNLEKIAEAMGVSMDYLWFGTGSGEGQPRIVQMFDKLPAAKQRQALRILEAFVDESDDEAGTAKPSA